MPELDVAPNAAETVSPAPVADAPVPDSPAPDATATDVFFKLDDRNVYPTKEDLIKSFRDTKDSYAELAPWKEFSNRFQVKSPAEMEELIAEYMELKRQADAAAQAPPAPVAANEYEKMSDTDVVSRAQAGDAQANAEWERRWVAQQAEKAGYVKKDYVDSRFKELQTSQTERQAEATRDSALKDGASVLGELLGKDNADLLDVAHSSIEEWIVRQSRDAKGDLIRGSLEDQFFKSAEDRRKVIEQGIQMFQKKLDGYVAKKTAATSTLKEKAIAAAPKPLPAGNTSAPPASKNGKPNMSFDDPDFKREVREMFVK